MHLLATPFALIGRIFISAIFILSGFQKLTDLAGTDAYIQAVGLPAGLALPAGLFELIGGICILIGFLVRPMALLFAVFCLFTALLFHNAIDDPTQLSAALKNIAIAGGFLILFAYGNVAYSLDSMRARRRHDRDVRDAEMRAATAEARADATERARL